MFNTFVFITFGYAVVLLVGAYRRLKVRTAGRPAQDEWISQIFGPAFIMVGALFANALAFMRSALTMREMDLMADGHWNQADYVLGASWDVIACVMGTGFLMTVVVRALDEDEVFEAEQPRGAGLRAQVIMFRRLLFRHWLAVFGLGTVFGVAAGGGVVLLLAGELTLMWAGCVVGLKIIERRGMDRPVWEQGCDVTGPDAIPPVTDDTPPTHSGTDQEDTSSRRAA